MFEAKIDVAVLLLFFNNPERFEKVFEQVKKARPTKLFLYQDGPRKDKNDIEGIMKCRDIVENGIDWDCSVKKWYRESNVGCDPSEYLSQKWAFSFVDKCIILEDDDVPSVSFFSFCKELLDKYENDTRIMMISGLNYDEITEDIEEDYLFSSICPIWGWATWRRVIDTWEERYDFLDNDSVIKQLEDNLRVKNVRKDFIKLCKEHKKTHIPYYETICAANIYLYSGLGITPRVNMINNIGFEGNSTHYTSPFCTMPKKERKVFEMGRYEINRELVHPKYIMENIKYRDRTIKYLGWNNSIDKILKNIEKVWLNLRYFGILYTFKKIAKKFNKKQKI